MENKFFNTILKPISNETKKSCIKLWATNHEEESNKKIDNIKEYCMKNGCDELSILYEIYKEIKSKYLCHIIYLDKFLNQVFNRYDYLSKDEIESKFGEDFTYFYDKTDENNIENMFNVLGVDIYYNKYLTKVNVCDDLLTHYESVHYEERNFDNEFLLIEIEELIEKCISENREYEYKVILKPKSIENMEDFEKKLYIPYSKNSNNSYIPTNIGISNLKQEPIDKKEEYVDKKEEEVKIEIDYKINDIEEDKEIKDNINQGNDIKNNYNIDIEAFKAYFKVDFTADCEDSGFNLLINDMRGDLPGYTKKEITALALVIKESDKIHHNKKYRVFRKWLVAFCGLINCEVPTYKENQVKNEFENFKAKYYYLFS